jgi:arylformamidase
MTAAERVGDEPVYLNYTQAELDRNFDQRGWIKNAEEVIARYTSRSKSTRELLKFQTASYGPGNDQTLDIFPAGTASSLVVVFLHGGAWRNFTKDEFSFAASAFVPAGFPTVVVNFPKLPGVRLPGVVAALQQALAFVHRIARSFGGDPERLYLCGHSSGAHLAASLATADDASLKMPRDCIVGCACISGCFDLEPVLLSARSGYVKLSKSEAAALSPLLHVDRLGCDVLIASAKRDTDEFKRQSDAFAKALMQAGKLRDRLEVSGVNHFEVVELLADPASDLFRRICRDIEIGRNVHSVVHPQQ